MSYEFGVCRGHLGKVVEKAEASEKEDMPQYAAGLLAEACRCLVTAFLVADVADLDDAIDGDFRVATQAIKKAADRLAQVCDI